MSNKGYSADTAFQPGSGILFGGIPANDSGALLARIANATEVIAAKYGMNDWTLSKKNIIPVATTVNGAIQAALSELIDSQTNRVCLMTFQCFNGSFDVFLSDSATFTDPNILPDLRVAAGGPIVIGWSGKPLQIRLRNNDTGTPASYSVLLSTTAG